MEHLQNATLDEGSNLTKECNVTGGTRSFRNKLREIENKYKLELYTLQRDYFTLFFLVKI